MAAKVSLISGHGSRRLLTGKSYMFSLADGICWHGSATNLATCSQLFLSLQLTLRACMLSDRRSCSSNVRQLGASQAQATMSLSTGTAVGFTRTTMFIPSPFAFSIFSNFLLLLLLCLRFCLVPTPISLFQAPHACFPSLGIPCEKRLQSVCLYHSRNLDPVFPLIP